MIALISVSTCVLGLSLGVMPTQAHARTADTIVAQDGMTLKIVLTDKASLRCGDQDVFYAIAELKANTPLRAAGTSGSFTKVVLPDSIGAFVPANEVDAPVGAKAVSLRVASKLRAPSHLLGLSGSWKAIYNTELPVGTRLTVIESIMDGAGVALGYRVIAPTSPSGELPIVYIKTDALRDATADEIGAFESGGGIIVPVVSDPEPETDSESSPANPAQVTDAEQVDTSMMEEMDLPTDEPVSETPDPVEIENTTPVDAAESPETPSPTQRTAPKGRVSASALEDLEAAFDKSRTLPKAELDEALDELHAEFARTRADAEEGSSLARALDQRVEWIKIRIETRDQRRAIAATLAAYDARADQHAQDIQAWQSGRAYQLVGRMVTSAVYTGEHLPLLYRVQGIDPTTGVSRTIGYVAPGSDQDFRHLLGRVVGVVGMRHDDQSLKLTVIEPDRIDPMPE